MTLDILWDYFDSFGPNTKVKLIYNNGLYTIATTYNTPEELPDDLWSEPINFFDYFSSKNLLEVEI